MKAQPISEEKTSSRKARDKAQRIRVMLTAGQTPTQIAATLGVTRQYVYGVRAYDKKKAAPPKRGPGRPKGSGKKSTSKGTVITSSPVLQPDYRGLQNMYPPTIPASLVEVSPPAPLGFMDRLRVLFTGRV